MPIFPFSESRAAFYDPNDKFQLLTVKDKLQPFLSAVYDFLMCRVRKFKPQRASDVEIYSIHVSSKMVCHEYQKNEIVLFIQETRMPSRKTKTSLQGGEKKKEDTMKMSWWNVFWYEEQFFSPEEKEENQKKISRKK